MERSTQTVSIVAGNVAYAFDAVIKAQHSGSLKIEDDPADAKGVKYVNNAAIEPRELSLDIMMSDVVTTADPMARAHASRSVSAFSVLEGWRKGRELLSVKTRLAIYPEMLVKSITVTEDDTNPEGLTASVVFREVLEKRTEKKKTGSGSGASAAATDEGEQAYGSYASDADTHWTDIRQRIEAIRMA